MMSKNGALLDQKWHFWGQKQEFGSTPVCREIYFKIRQLNDLFQLLKKG